jgi:hypothetical protein
MCVDKPVIAGPVTTNITPLLCADATVTAIGPVVAPAGTVAAIVVLLQVVGMIGTPLNITVLLP